MRVGRTLPPAAAPFKWVDLLHGVRGLFKGDRQRADLERDLKEYFGVKHVFCVNSGKTALTLILVALQRLSPRREVILPAYTCFSVPSAVVKAGLKVRLCDINASTFDYDFEQLSRQISAETLCVVPTHLFGIPADMDRLLKLCRPYGVAVVEDAAQAMGGRDHGRWLGTIGDVGFFSLGRGKMITCGEGGVILTNSDCIAREIEKDYLQLGSAGISESFNEWLMVLAMAILIRPSLYWLPAGMPMLKLGKTFFCQDFPLERLSSMKVGLMTHWRERLAESVSCRVHSAASLQEGVNTLGSQKARLPFLRFPLLLESRRQRDAVFNASQGRGLGLSTMYPSALSGIEEILDSVIDPECPVATSVAQRLIALPTHRHVTDQDRERIFSILKSSTAETHAHPLQEGSEHLPLNVT